MYVLILLQMVLYPYLLKFVTIWEGFWSIKYSYKAKTWSLKCLSHYKFTNIIQAKKSTRKQILPPWVFAVHPPAELHGILQMTNTIQ